MQGCCESGGLAFFVFLAAKREPVLSNFTLFAPQGPFSFARKKMGALCHFFLLVQKEVAKEKHAKGGHAIVSPF